MIAITYKVQHGERRIAEQTTELPNACLHILTSTLCTSSWYQIFGSKIRKSIRDKNTPFFWTTFSQSNRREETSNLGLGRTSLIHSYLFSKLFDSPFCPYCYKENLCGTFLFISRPQKLCNSFFIPSLISFAFLLTFRNPPLALYLYSLQSIRFFSLH